MRNRIQMFAVFILLAGVVGCKKESPAEVTVSKALYQVGQTISSDTLAGAVKGTLVAGKTYYMKTNVSVNAGDTLLMQPGAKLIAIGDGLTVNSSPELTIKGTFLSLGTKDAQNWLTIPDANKTHDGLWAGSWGGIQADTTCATMVIKWTHIEGVGGPAGPNAPATYATGDPRYGILFQNPFGNLVLEDSWITGTKDDGMRVIGGKIAIFRNTFEDNGQAGGESVNIKSGTVGDIAYNLFIGAATNGPKTSNSGTSSIQTNVNVYNNTIINCGMRQVKTGRGGSMNIEKGAKGKFFNNIIVNSRFGLRIVKDADTVNFTYGNNFYYGASSVIVGQFNASDGVAKTQASDVRKDSAKANNPMFAGYDVNKYDLASWTFPVSSTQQADDMLFQKTSSFKLSASSPAIGKGKTDFSALSPISGLTGDVAPTILQPGKDLGAFQTDGTGNKH